MRIVLQIIYILLAGYLVFLIGWNLIKTKKKAEIISAFMVLVLLLLRIFFIK